MMAKMVIYQKRDTEFHHISERQKGNLKERELKTRQSAEYV